MNKKYIKQIVMNAIKDAMENATPEEYTAAYEWAVGQEKTLSTGFNFTDESGQSVVYPIISKDPEFRKLYGDYSNSYADALDQLMELRKYLYSKSR